MKDSLGRELIGEVQEIKALLQNAKVGHATHTNESKPSKSSDKIEGLLQEIDENFEKSFKKTKKYFENLIKASKAESKVKSNDDGCCEKLTEAIKSLGKVQEKAFEEFSADNKKMHRALSGLGNSGGGGGGGGGGNVGGGANPGGVVPSFGALGEKKNWAKIASWGENLGTKLLGGYSPLQHIMDGVIDKNLEFSNELKRIAWRTQGVTGDMKGLQGQWESSVMSWDKLTEINGQSMKTNAAMFEKISKKGLVRNIKDLKSINKLMATSGHSAKILGANAENTADLFSDWSMHLGMSDTQIGQMGLHMGTVQKETGITGDQMVEVARASQDILKNLKKYGNLTSTSASLVLNLMARAKKYDLTEEIGGLIKPLQSFSDFLEADGPLKSGMIMAASRVGLEADLLQGTIFKDKAKLAELAKGMSLSGDDILAGFGYTMDNYKTIPAEMRGMVDQVFKQTKGMTVDQYSRSIKAIQESSKSFADKLKELNDEQTSALVGNTEAGREVAEGLEKQKKDLKIASKMEAINAIKSNSEGIKGPASGKQLMSEIKLQEMTGMASTGDDLADVKNVMMQAAQDIANAGGEDLTNKISGADLTNTSVLQSLGDQLTEAYQKTTVKESEETNATDEFIRKLNKANSWLATIAAPLLSWLPVQTFYLAAIASTLPGLIGMGGGLLKGAGGLLRGGAGLLGIGGAGAGATAAGATAAGATGATAAGGGAAAALSAVALPAAILAGVVALAGACNGMEESGKRAGEIFNKNQKDITFAEKNAAENAGFLTGALNALTFGLFDCFEPTGWLTVKIANFFKDWPIFGAILNGLLLPFKILWGVLKGLWNFLKGTFLGIWEGIKIAIEPLVPIAQELWKSVTDLWSAFTGMFGATGSGIDVIGMLAKAGEWLGWALGGTIKALAKVVSWIFKLGIWLVKLIFSPKKAIEEAINFFKNIDWKWVGDKLKAVFIDFPIWLGTQFMSGLKAVFIDFPIWLGTQFMSGLKAVFIDFPQFVWQQIKDGLAGLRDWILSMLPEDQAKKIRDNNLVAEKMNQNFSKVVQEKAQKATQSPEGRAEAERVLESLKGALKGAKSNVARDQKQLDDLSISEKIVSKLPWWLGGTDLPDVINASKAGEENNVRHIENQIATLEEQLKAPLETTAKTMEQGADPGSIYVHDIHVEGMLKMLAGVLMKQSSPAGNAFGNLFGETSNATATSAPISDVYDRVREQNASNTAEVPRSASLARIDEVSEKQLDRLISIDNNIAYLIAMMNAPEVVTGIAANTDSPDSQQHNLNTPEYGFWPSSLTARGMGNIQVQSDGVVT